MKNKLLFITTLVLFFGMFRVTLLGADFTNSEVALKGYEKLTGVIENNFKQTADALMAAPDDQTPDWKTIRALKTKLWLQLLNQIDNARDLNFNFADPKNGYSANVAPPHFGDSGIDPASIKNPEDRQIYEDAIQENHAKAVKINFERQLNQQDEGLTATAIQYFNSVYKKTPEDAKELVGCLDSLTDSKHNAEMKEKLHEFLELAKEQNK